MMQKDERVPNFKELGIDHIIVDESQQFKNLEFSTSHTQVAGIGTPDGSQRAFNLLIACRTLQAHYQADQGITFASGTTISNSLTELHSLFKYLCPRKISKLKIKSFDAFATMFAEKSVNYELNITGGIKTKERFRSFMNIPELIDLYIQIADIRIDDNLNIDKPKLIKELVIVEPTEEQKIINKKLIKMADSVVPSTIASILEQLTGRKISNKDVQAKMLLATNLAKKMSVDLKLIDPIKYKNFISPKLDKMTDSVLKNFKDTEKFLSTQFIFSDIGIPKKNSFNVYNEIKNMFIDKGINNNQIVFIHDYNTEKKKQKLFEAVNNGSIRIIIGSTQKMGTGVNMQKRCVAMHHVDIPWRPSDLIQREGRGARQGNEVAKKFMNNEIKASYYSTRNTLDAYQYEIIQNKQRLINQIKNNSANRKIDEGGDETLTYAEYVAALTGNDNLLKLVKIDQTIDGLNLSKKSYNLTIKDIEKKISNNINKINRLSNSLIIFNKEKEYLVKTINSETISSSMLSMKIIVPPLINKIFSNELHVYNDKKKTTIVDFGNTILKIAKLLNNSNFPVKNYKICEEFKYSLILSKQPDKIEFKLKSPLNIIHAPTNFINTPLKAGKFIIDVLQKILDRPAKQLRLLRDFETENQLHKEFLSQMPKSFPKEKELKEKIAEKIEIEKTLNNLNDNEEKNIAVSKKKSLSM